MAIKTSLGSASLVEVLDSVLDKGIVIKPVGEGLQVGLEILAVEARVVITSVEA